MADADPIQRLNAALEGRYRIERELGAGGMATVYLAEDVRHHRNVALKVLKPELAAVVGADRFLTEIETTANLQHPHILPLFDSGEAGGFLFYVMPYVEGESLRRKLEREHQLPVDEAVRIATNVAEALDYAHRQGVIHRDIKPANILLLDGKPVVSDFGIALAVGTAGGGRLTETGLSLGTPHYMSPEQATGDLSVGPETDIYALGCVLYEMLVGEPPYTGSTAQAVLGRIVTGDARPVSEERSTVPAHVEAVTGRALEKVPADRFAAAGEMARALGDEAFRWGEQVAAAPSRSGVHRAWKPAALGLGLAALLLALGWTASSFREDPPQVRYSELLLPDGMAPAPAYQTSQPLSISADGSRVGLRVEDEEGVGQVWVRDITTSIDPIRVTTLDGSFGSIALSSDGGFVAFNDGAEAAIRQAPTLGARPLTVGPTGLRANQSGFRGLSYGPGGSIVFGTTEGISRLPPGGGDPEILTSVADETVQHWDPRFLPDGSGILFTERGQASRAQRLMVLRFGDDAPAFLTEGHSGRVTAEGILVYGRGGWQDRALSVARLDASWSSLEGEPVTVIEGIDEHVVSESPRLMYDLAADGTLVYLPHDPRPRVAQIVLLDRETGAETVALDEADPRFPAGIQGFGQVRFSPDGQRIALATRFSAAPNFQLFTYDLARDLLAPVRVDRDADWPVWSADGERIAFNRFRVDDAEEQNLYWAPADNTEQPEPLIPPNAHQQHAQEFTRDGPYLVYMQRDVPFSADSDIWLLPLDGNGSARPLVDQEGHQSSASVSPDSRWMAYISNESGSYQVYVTEFPDPRTRRQVTTEPAWNPVWSPTGEELYYMRSEDRAVFAVSVRTDGGIEFGEPERIAEGRFAPMYAYGRGIDVRPDGTLLLTRIVEDEDPPPAIVMIQNFDQLARELIDH